ncbi:MAG: hypothetical protein PVI86_02130 [Phycisphaerae bacterium]
MNTTLKRLCTAAVCCGSLLLASNAKAETRTLVAGANPGVPSYFTLDFGEFGGRTTAFSGVTDMELEVDADAGTARYVHYYQEVDPLTLPGGFSTGNLTIEIVAGSSSGTYDRLTGEFATTETYLVYFEGDLSAFGLESPVELPSASVGTVQFAGTDGEIVLDWDGAGTLIHPFDPLEIIDFSYFCTLNAQFAPEAIALVELALEPEVENANLAPAVENDLMGRLGTVKAALEAGNQRLAGVRLRAFGSAVDAYADNGAIDPDDANLMIDLADAIADMVRPTVFRR